MPVTPATAARATAAAVDSGGPGDLAVDGAGSPFGGGSWKLGPVQKLGSTINTSKYEASPWLAPDGKTLTFAVGDQNGSSANWRLQRAVRSQAGNGSFGPATPLSALNAPGEAFSLSMSADGLSAVLTCDWSSPGGTTDLWVGRRPSAGVAWTPKHFTLAAATSGADAELDGLISWDGLRVYFVINRNQNGRIELYRAQRGKLGGDFGAPVAITELNTSDREDSPALSPDEAVIVFNTDRPGGAGGEDLWWAQRTSAGTFGPAQPMPGLNTAASEREAFISHDGRELFFSSNRPAGGTTQWEIFRVQILQGP